MTRPPDPIRISTAFVALLSFASLPFFATALQQPVSQNDQSKSLPSSQQQPWSEHVDGYRQPSAAQGDFKSHHQAAKPPTNNRVLVSTDVRALATLAPDALGHTVRAPPARSAGPSGRLSPRLPARSLQDWEVEDIVLLATVDGKIHARDRNSGEHRWNLESVSPMVETIYHTRNASSDGEGSSNFAEHDFLFIVEPSQDGSLYTFSPNTPLGMRKMGLTVKQLVEELSPYAGDDPAVVYTGEKRNTLYTIDIANGNILKMFTSANLSMVNQSPHRTPGFESLDSDKCEGTLTLTRTEYTVSVQDRNDGQPICTIKYFEWGPNNRDKDLQLQHSNAKDNRHIYSFYDGRVLALDYSKEMPSKLNPTFKHKFESPVARVFDVARPRELETRGTSRIILPQPFPQIPDETASSEQETRVFVNCTESGSFYALSEATYPMVTEDASFAQCFPLDYPFHKIPTIAAYTDDQLREALVGVHSLSLDQQHPEVFLQISDSEDFQHSDEPADIAPQNSNNTTVQYRGIFPFNAEYPLLLLLLCLGGIILRWQLWPSNSKPELYKNNKIASFKAIETSAEISTSIEDASTTSQATKLAKSVKFLDEHPPITVPILDDGVDPASIPLPEDESFDFDTGTIADEPQVKSGKARRGKRGGRKLQKKPKGSTEAVDVAVSLAEAVKQDEQKIVAITPDAANNESPAANLGLQNLIIHTKDPPLGNGSGGTFVFKGEFEGREVAVKRMLPQYFELMSQEVAMLEQSEDHPNVIRYFCRRQDQHFLYIALELCQGSLFDLFKDGRGDEIDRKFYDIRNHVMHDPRAILRQLAEGLLYLHKYRIVHRDIKPQNMLIAFPKKNSLSNFPRLVISDFGLCKTLPDNASTLIGTTGNAGTAGWKAPELIFQPRDITGTGASTSKDSQSGDAMLIGSLSVKRAVDIFSMGCVFFYVFTQGRHPFDDEEGWMQLRERNIKTNKVNFGPLSFFADTAPDIVDLIRRMLAPEPENRPTASQVLKHPFFWSAEERLDFLSTASDRFDQEPRDGSSWQLDHLEKYAEDIIPWNTSRTSMSGGSNSFVAAAQAGGAVALDVPERNFLARLDAKFVATLGKQRKYQGGKVVDLLRALRNKHHHWDDMPDDVKRKVGELPEGYLTYWEERFVGLVLSVWIAIRQVGWEKERRFKRFYDETV